MELLNRSELRMNSADSFCKSCRRREVYTVPVWWTRRAQCRWAYLGDDALAEEAREFHQRSGLDSLSTNRHSLGRRKWRSVMGWPWSTELSFYRRPFPDHCGKVSGVGACRSWGGSTQTKPAATDCVWPNTRAKLGFKHYMTRTWGDGATSNATPRWTANQLVKSIVRLIAFQFHSFILPRLPPQKTHTHTHTKKTYTHTEKILKVMARLMPNH